MPIAAKKQLGLIEQAKSHRTSNSWHNCNRYVHKQ